MKFLFTAIFLLMSSTAFAEELITSIEQGEPAPFDGTLFNTEAAAKLAAELESSQELCQIEIDREVLNCKASGDAKADEILAELIGCQERSTIEIDSLNDQIEMLDKKIKHLSTPSRTTMFATGTAVGVSLTLITAFAIGSITN